MQTTPSYEARMASVSLKPVVKSNRVFPLLFHSLPERKIIYLPKTPVVSKAGNLQEMRPLRRGKNGSNKEAGVLGKDPSVPV